MLFTIALLIGSLELSGDENTGELASYDAIVAAPNNHQVVFENEKVRVLDVTIKPGEKEPFHVHPMPGVMNIIAGSKLRITEASLQDGTLVIGETIEVGKG
jgi:quercetin dioxygenase-like cupin family protein